MKRFTLSELLIAIMITSVLVAVVFPTSVRICQNARMTRCAANQSQLIAAMYNYTTGHGRIRFCCSETGGAWWLSLWAVNEVDQPEVFWCPVFGDGLSGETHFRGPAREVNGYLPEAFVGADRPDNHLPHEPINAVKKSGDVVRIERGMAEYERAMQETKP